MARKKKTAPKEAKAINAEFVGGPKDGRKLMIRNPPPEKIRLVEGINDWCTYEWDAALGKYRHIGDVKIEYEGIV